MNGHGQAGSAYECAAVITGASSGIGAACALKLDALGWRVFATVRCAEAEARLRRQASGRLSVLRLDVTDSVSILALAASVAEALEGKGLDGLINNAGIGGWGPLEHTSTETFEDIFSVNVVGQIAVTQAFVELLSRRRGRIVNMGSVSGLCAFPLFGAYSASKHALEAVTDTLRIELAPRRIEVILIEAGRISTPIWKKAADVSTRPLGDEAQSWYGPALQRLGHAAAAGAGLPPERVADAVAQALTARRPKTRYLVGRDAWRGAFLRWLPDRWRDRVLARRLSLPGRPPK